MARYGLVMDVGKCNGCYNCFLACRDEHCGNDFPPYSAAQPMSGHAWLRLLEKERGSFPKVKVAYVAVTCMHCEDAPCVSASQDGAVYAREDGIVLIDPEKAVGRREILSTCPYRVISWNEERQLPQKCGLCAHLLDRGFKEPRCSEACPTGALVFGDLDDPGSEVARLVASGLTEPLRAGYGIGEKVLYAGLPKRFVAGAVVFGDTDACGEGVTVRLTGDDVELSRVTDAFGDFEFEGLATDTVFTVSVRAGGYATVVLDVKTLTDVYAGEIVLEPVPALVAAAGTDAAAGGDGLV